MEDSNAVVKEFGEGLFSEQHKGHTIIAHNFRIYDGHFILKYLLDNQHKGISYETQLPHLQYRSAGMNARDTLSFAQQMLANFPEAVGLNRGNVNKGDFPHYANVTGNWNIIFPYPTAIKYLVEKKSSKKQKQFLEWHAAKGFLAVAFLTFDSRW